MLRQKLSYLVPLFLFCFICGIYIHNLSRSVYGGDVGDVVSASIVLGVAHPPGYPLFTLLGFFLSHLFPALPPAMSVGLISAVSGALGISIFFLLFKKITNTQVSFLSSLILAFLYPYWFYSEIAEVFALHTFFVICLLFLAIRFTLTRKEKDFFLLSFVAGLANTNHQTSILLFPGILILCFSDLHKYSLKRWKKYSLFLIKSSVAFLLGLSIYLYVPIASSTHPPINWDNVSDISSFFHLILRQDYGTFTAGQFTKPDLYQGYLILKAYFWYLFTQLTIPVVAGILLGIVYLWQQNRRLLFGLGISFLLTGPLFIYYAGFPLYGNFFLGVYERFFSASIVILFFFFPFGIFYLCLLLQKISLRRQTIHLVFLTLFIIPLLLFVYNFPKTNLSTVFTGDNLAKDILQPLPKNSVVFLAGDTVLFNTWYAKYGLHLQPGVDIVNINGALQNDYFNTVKIKTKDQYPKLTGSDLVVATIKNIQKERPVFSFQQIQGSKGNELNWLPYGMVFRLLSNAQTLPESVFVSQTTHLWSSLHVPSRQTQTKAQGSLTISEIPMIYANQMLILGNYFIDTYQDFPRAKQWYDKAFMLDPDYAKTSEVIGVYYLTYKKNCGIAASYFRKTIALDPSEKMGYFLLYSTYRECLKDSKSANAIATMYSKSFQSNFTKDFKKIIQK